VGYGFSGKSFHSYLIRHPSNALVLYGVVARGAETRNQVIKDLGEGVKVWETLDDALEDKNVNVVVVASTNLTHASLALQALKKKKHVVVEKPMALSVSDGMEMIKTAAENNVLLTVFQNRRWDGDFLTVQELLKEKKLGKVSWIEVSWSKYGFSSKVWKMDATKNGGGRFWDFSTHLLDQLLLLMSPHHVTSVHCKISNANPAMPATDTHAALTVTFKDGTTVVVSTSSGSFYDKPRWLLCGEDGTYVKFGVDPQEVAMVAGDIGAAVEDVAGELKTGRGVEKIPTLRGDWLKFYQNVGEAVQGKAPLVVKAEEVVRVLAVIETALQSAEQGQVIKTDI